MSIVMARLDSRLLHGIVATQWTPLSGATRVMVIDDHVADDPVLKEAMRMGKPAGVSLSIINRQTAYENFKTGKYEGQKVFIISDNPEIFLDLIMKGQQISTLILGGTQIPENSDDFIKVSKRACIKRSDINIFKQIASSGTKIVVQFVPNDPPILLSKFIEL
jgi:mannose/fructose/N-acetylgalactosamine-specific phosphotransferase system component IIB